MGIIVINNMDMAGYLPDSEPVVVDDFDEALEYALDEALFMLDGMDEDEAPEGYAGDLALLEALGGASDLRGDARHAFETYGATGFRMESLHNGYGRKWTIIREEMV